MWFSKRIFSIVIGIAAIALMICASAYAVMSVSANYNTGVIVIDAGHGGIDGGSTADGLMEKDLTLDISKRLKAVLEASGYKVTMTRNGDEALAENKKEDMQERKKVIEKAKPDMVVSIHINKYTASYRRGVQVFYDDTGRNKSVAERMQSVINTYVNDRYIGRNDLICLSGDYFMTKCTEYPSIIVECGFISNAKDRELLRSEEYKNALADAMAKGVQGMIEEKLS